MLGITRVTTADLSSCLVPYLEVAPSNKSFTALGVFEANQSENGLPAFTYTIKGFVDFETSKKVARNEIWPPPIRRKAS